MKNKIFYGFFAVLLCAVFCGCSNGRQQGGPEPVDHGEMRGLTAKELIAEMKTGWNLGNSLDSIGKNETAWGNPATTLEMIQAVSEKGFDILRVPVTWGQHMDENYAVETEFMDRVQEVVDYGISCGMYVILNTHHEPDSWLKPESDSMEKVEPQFTALWTQIAERFADYGDKLVFEGLNEPRVKGTPTEWTGGTPDGRECVNKLNKIFVDTVRSGGGNNAKRLLLVATYAQAVTRDAFTDFVAKYDDYTGVAVHAYTPYSFTYHSGESFETFVWDGSEKKSVETTFNTINEFLLSEGVPVIITEYGSVKKPLEDYSSNTEERIKWLKDYLSMAKDHGIPCVWWDNNFYNSGNELFGIFDRATCQWTVPEVADAIMELYRQ